MCWPLRSWNRDRGPIEVCSEHARQLRSGDLYWGGGAGLYLRGLQGTLPQPNRNRRWMNQHFLSQWSQKERERERQRTSKITIEKSRSQEVMHEQGGWSSVRVRAKRSSMTISGGGGLPCRKVLEGEPNSCFRREMASADCHFRGRSFGGQKIC